MKPAPNIIRKKKSMPVLPCRIPLMPNPPTTKTVNASIIFNCSFPDKCWRRICATATITPARILVGKCTYLAAKSSNWLMSVGLTLVITTKSAKRLSRGRLVFHKGVLVTRSSSFFIKMLRSTIATPVAVRSSGKVVPSRQIGCSISNYKTTIVVVIGKVKGSINPTSGEIKNTDVVPYQWKPCNGMERNTKVPPTRAETSKL